MLKIKIYALVVALAVTASVIIFIPAMLRAYMDWTTGLAPWAKDFLFACISFIALINILIMLRSAWKWLASPK